MSLSPAMISILFMKLAIPYACYARGRIRSSGARRFRAGDGTSRTSSLAGQTSILQLGTAAVKQFRGFSSRMQSAHSGGRVMTPERGYVAGTASDVGKVCWRRVYAAFLSGWSAYRAVWKMSQNMANSGITPDGRDGAQIFQAEARGDHADIAYEPGAAQIWSQRSRGAGRADGESGDQPWMRLVPLTINRVCVSKSRAVYNSWRRNMTLLCWKAPEPAGKSILRDRDIVNMEWRKWPVSGYSGGGYRRGVRIRHIYTLALLRQTGA